MIGRHFHKRNLPHLYYNEGIYFITYRLCGSIHPDQLKKLQGIISSSADKEQKKIFKKYDELLEVSSNNIKHLSNPKISDVCKESIMFFNKKDIRVICYCIMPNHVHLVFELINKNKSITDLMKSIKRYSAKKANEILETKGRFWQVESFDRLVRDERELYNIIKYVLLNPVKAGLVENYTDWQYTYCHPDYDVL